MRIIHSIRRLFGLSKPFEPSENIASDDIEDIHADEFFGVFNGQPMTFRQFNAELAAHYQGQSARATAMQPANTNAELTTNQ